MRRAERLKEAAGDQCKTAFTLSVIIPTKNRPVDLARTVETLLTQTMQPLELIIVDQSTSRTFTQPIPIPLEYIHDPSLSGLTAARNAAMSIAKGEIWLFLDDDVILEPEFLEQILHAYHPGVTGVSGIITNYSVPRFRQRLWERVFRAGPFHDERQTVYRNVSRLRDSRPVRVSQLGGGLMSFRASAVRDIKFDTSLTGSSAGEDIEFCARLPKESVLLIAPKARLVHNRSPQSRDATPWFSIDAQVASYMYHRHWKKGLWYRACYAWLSVGYACIAGLTSAKRRSALPWRAWRAGVRTGKRIALKLG